MSARRFVARSAACAALVALLLLFAVPLATASSAAAAEHRAPAAVGLSTPAEAAVVVDAGSGDAIAAEDADERRPIASATKLMTALLVIERADPQEVLAAADYEPAPVESQIGLRPGERLTVHDLLVALLLESANDAAVTLAEGVAGSTEAFVAEMNARADELGLDETSYANPIGFDDPDNYSTASDQAELARRLMRDARFRDIVEESSARLTSGDRPRVVENRNDLVGEVPFVNGVKTGHTLEAGHVLVGSAADEGNRVVSVVLGAPSETARDAATLELLRYGLDQFVERRVVAKGESVARAAVAGDDDRVELEAARDLTVTLLRGQHPNTRIDAPAELEGPLDAGEEVGSVAVVQGGRVAERVPLVTSSAVEAPGLLNRVATSLEDNLTAVVTAAVVLVAAVAMFLARGRRRRARAGGERLE